MLANLMALREGPQAIVHAFAEQRAGFDRGARMRRLEGVDAVTIQQKVSNVAVFRLIRYGTGFKSTCLFLCVAGARGSCFEEILRDRGVQWSRGRGDVYDSVR